MNEEQLHAYADGLLDRDERARIEAALAASPFDAARVQSWMRQNELLRASFDPVLLEPVPDRLRLLRIRRAWLPYAMAAVWVVLGIAIGVGGADLLRDRDAAASASLAPPFPVLQHTSLPRFFFQPRVPSPLPR